MIPAQRNKIDISKMTEEEQKLFRLYGKLPTHKNVITKMQKDRKFFDSGDYALSKAGKAPQNTVGTAIPSPENIPHAATPPAGQQLSSSPTNGVTSPVKESSLHHSDTEEDTKEEVVEAPAEPAVDPFDEAAASVVESQ
ncbi:Endosulfine-domain-containing protein [Punctularia strigosozonata HHB-11173 SS5]|uniref:Endosulfine-domain-containing protein n=1 Tax=Punctularia strigosozonata (strain HHB-11173) TaxID=741275 RepID=UPI0004417D56|nr:Endosulfine-domain-containing protein [Punctularia strigosozonata HHB-11173 SS5]EIN12825.1 Endosulfine-domain-containing protein [Punctularia strigosozonata HHB-11173 SS5]